MRVHCRLAPCAAIIAKAVKRWGGEGRGSRGQKRRHAKRTGQASGHRELSKSTRCKGPFSGGPAGSGAHEATEESQRHACKSTKSSLNSGSKALTRLPWIDALAQNLGQQCGQRGQQAEHRRAVHGWGGGERPLQVSVLVGLVAEVGESEGRIVSRTAAAGSLSSVVPSRGSPMGRRTHGVWKYGGAPASTLRQHPGKGHQEEEVV